MAIVKMKKLSVIGMNAEKRSLLKDLMNLGAVEVSNGADRLQEDDWRKLVVKDSDDENALKYDKMISKADRAREILSEYGKIKKPLFAVRKIVSEKEFKKILEKEDIYNKQLEEILTLNEKLEKIAADENTKTAQILSLMPWKNYELPLEEKNTGRLVLRLGVIPPMENASKFAEKISEEGCECEITELASDKEQRYISFWYFKEDEEKILGKAKTLGYTNATIDDFVGTVSENIERLNYELELLAKEKENTISEIEKKSEYIEGIEYFHDIMVIKRDEARVRNKLLMTDETFTFDGWIPEKSTEKIENILGKYTCWYELNEPSKDDDIPVKLTNKKFFSPVEFITNMYSLPSAREIDPTAIYTFFYIVFFGIMFGDVGYGIILCLGSALMLKKGKLYEGSACKLMKVLFYSGISSIFWGVMFGSFFGDLIPVFAESFLGKSIIIKPLWLDPAKSSMTFLIFSCALGVIHLFVGMGIKAYEQIKDGHFLEAVNDNFIWYAIVLGLIMWLFGGSISETLTTVGKYMAIIGIIAALILPVFIAKGAGKAIGPWNLYSGITGNLSDILSYSRLLGLGLASTSIAAVINFLASMGGEGFVGIVMFIVIEILGHTLNFAINALGAFVHSCRLQYVEFFGRFYEGGGREFKPFNRNTKYINVIEEGK